MSELFPDRPEGYHTYWLLRLVPVSLLLAGVLYGLA